MSLANCEVPSILHRLSVELHLSFVGLISGQDSPTAWVVARSLLLLRLSEKEVLTKEKRSNDLLMKIF